MAQDGWKGVDWCGFEGCDSEEEGGSLHGLMYCPKHYEELIRPLPVLGDVASLVQVIRELVTQGVVVSVYRGEWWDEVSASFIFEGMVSDHRFHMEYPLKGYGPESLEKGLTDLGISFRRERMWDEPQAQVNFVEYGGPGESSWDPYNEMRR